MKFIILLFIILIPINVFAKSYGTITSSGNGIVRIKPTHAIINITIQEFNKSHKIVYKKLINTISNITPYLKKYATLKTTNITITKHKIYKNNKWNFNGYNGIENLKIKVTNKNTNKVILYLMKNKSITINNISSIVSNLNKFTLKAIKIAYKNAFSKIKVILKLIGVNKYKIISIDIKNNTQRVFAPMVMARMSKQVYFSGKNRATANVYLKVKY